MFEHVPKIRAIIFLFFFIYSITTCTDATLDLCHGDPELQVTERTDCRADSSILIGVPSLHGNPYHALHDVSWAVSHYLAECVPRENIPLVHVWIFTEAFKAIDTDLCMTEDARDPAHALRRPKWGACLIWALAKRTGISGDNVHFTERPPQGCYARTVMFPPKFRPLEYRARPLERTWWSHRRNLPQMPRDRPVRALAALADAAVQVYGDASEDFSGRRLAGRDTIRILIYDRMKARRRRWRNVNATISLLKNEQTVIDMDMGMDMKMEMEIVHTSTLPSSTAGQLKLFRDADIVLTPHGAALANSVFMRPGTQIVEIVKCCADEVRTSPTKPRDWTGWHAEIMQLGLTYVQCHEEGKYKTVQQLKEANDNSHDESDESDEAMLCTLRFFEVAPLEALEAVKDAVRNIRRFKKSGNGGNGNNILDIQRTLFRQEVTTLAAVLGVLLLLSYLTFKTFGRVDINIRSK